MSFFLLDILNFILLPLINIIKKSFPFSVRWNLFAILFPPLGDFRAKKNERDLAKNLAIASGKPVRQPA